MNISRCLRVTMSSLQSAAANLPIRATDAIASPASDRRAYRMSSLDILRGLVIVVMALDHVRDFVMTASVQDPTADPGSGPLLFATRWITHFCAPTFVFLAGVSAGLMAQRKSPSSLARFLVVRGLWLIVLEVLVVSTAASFAPLGIAELGGRTYVGLQVIWAIGASMVALAAVQYLGSRACFALGVAIIFGHNLCGWCSMRARFMRWARSRSISPTPCFRGLASCSSVTRRPVSFRALLDSVMRGCCGLGLAWYSGLLCCVRSTSMATRTSGTSMPTASGRHSCRFSPPQSTHQVFSTC